MSSGIEMNHLAYLKLNGWHQHLHPLTESIGWFFVGNDACEVVLPLLGEVLFEHQFSDKLNTVEADAEFLAATGNKKIPHDVVCYCREHPAGGWK